LTFFKKTSELQNDGGKKIHHPRKCEEAGCQEIKMLGVGRNRCSQLGKEYTYMYMYKEEKKNWKARGVPNIKETETEKRTTTAKATHT